MTLSLSLFLSLSLSLSLFISTRLNKLFSILEKIDLFGSGWGPPVQILTYWIHVIDPNT